MSPIEICLSAAVILISLAALINAIWQGLLTREHNKLSVKPSIVYIEI